jgi:lipopolysaccharide export system protein LptA
MDGQRGTTVLSGNAAVSQGTMLLRADRIEVREQADGYRAANALGSKPKPAFWRQRADSSSDEVLEGTAERIEFDERANTLRFAGTATLRRMRGAAVVQEVNGSLIVWDSTAELFKVEGGAATSANPSGRVRVVLSPRPEAAASASPSAAPTSAPSSARPATPLAPVRSLGDRP